MNTLNIKTIVSFIAVAAVMASCTSGSPEIDRVQPNLVDKSIFEGEWWVTQTAIDVDADATGITWNGEAGWSDVGVDKGSSGSVGKIVWAIDEDFLYAYRSFELVDGANSDGNDPDFRGQPFAAYPILAHVDVRQDYNPVTGEAFNVTIENTDDRRWFERKYMRVDWSENKIKSFSFAADLNTLGGWRLEPSSFFIQDGDSQGAFPREWEPQFVTVGEDTDYRFRDEWPVTAAEHADEEGNLDLDSYRETMETVHYMSFVNMMTLSPGGNCLLIGGGDCKTSTIPYRTAFLRVPPNHTYATGTQSHAEFDDFGIIRSERRTYARGGRNPAEVGRRCEADADCGTGGHCDVAEHLCVGGLTEDYGETDALAFYRSRHSFFKKSLTDQACVADWQCDGRYEGVKSGSICDRAAERCTIPTQERETRQVTYHLNPGYPAYLVKPAYQVMGDWNEVFMRGVRATRGEALPDYASQRIDCQAADPTEYCYCGSPDDVGGTCKGKYDPFREPSSYGIDNPYRCHIQNTEFSEPAHPTSYDEYTLPGAYRYEFVGDECLLLLKSNTCDIYRADKTADCADVIDLVNDEIKERNKGLKKGETPEPLLHYEQLGDLRYQFFNYIDQVNTFFGGVSLPMTDPTNGELINSPASFSAGSVERWTERAVEFFPVLRCAGEQGCAPGDEGAEERYLTGENLRGYYARLGQVEHPIGIATSGSDGFTGGDQSRPAIQANVNGAFQDAMYNVANRVDRLYGREGRSQIMSDRLRRLEGTSIEQRFVGSLGNNGIEAMTSHFDHGQDHVFGVDPSASIFDQDVMDQVSPFRGQAQLRSLTGERRRQQQLAERFICDFNEEAIFRSRYLEYWAEAFRGRPLAEASIRMQQLYTKMVQYHEMGHSVGLEHNFGASFDRDNYGDGYFNVVYGEMDGATGELPLPRMDDYDANNDGFVGRGEFDEYIAELRRVRKERAKLGIHNYMSSSTMDYSGDLSDAQGLGRYDVAATVWNYFDMKEAYIGDPVDRDVRFQDLKQSHITDRTWFRAYLGGESCEVDAQCPFAEGSPALAPGQPVYQRCIRNPRETTLQQPCRAGDENCQCSSFDLDMQDFEDDVAYITDANNDRVRDYSKVEYRFCTNSRVNDISWCNMFDAGESFREAIDHYRRVWEESYPANYYRRFRRGGARGFGTVGSVIDAAKIYQHLFYRFFFEPGFDTDTGPLGFDDQFLASVDAMNWLIQIANLPEEGSYKKDGEIYRWVSESLDVPDTVQFLPGQAFGTWTKYQEGYFGFFRPERAGVFYDKYFAMQALAIRDWGLSFNADERYFINFYDLFPTEMTEFFGGVVLQDPTWYAPRIEETPDGLVVKHMDWYRGTCTSGNAAGGCELSQAEVYPGPVLDNTSNEILRSWSAILALAQFPVYYDTTFQQRLQIFKAGSGAGFTIPEIQNDGSPTCVYGSDALLQGHFVVDNNVPNGCDTADDADYVAYTSERLRTPYVAVKIRPDLEFNFEEEQLGFQILRRLVDLQTEVNALTASEERARKLNELRSTESFLEYLIELQSAYGISNFF